MDDLTKLNVRSTRSSSKKRSSSEGPEHHDHEGESPVKKLRPNELPKGSKPGGSRGAKSRQPATQVGLATTARKRARFETEPDPDEDFPCPKRPKPTFESLPVEIKLQIFQEALTGNAPIQPVEPDLNVKRWSKQHKTLPVKEKTIALKRHEVKSGVGLLATSSWAYNLGVDLFYENNTIDFSGTELGAMTIRRFRRRTPASTRQKIRHVVIGARMIQVPRGYHPTEKKPDRNKKLLRACKEADKKFARRLRGGSDIADLARTFPNLQTLRIKKNVGDWNPAGKVHWDLFGDQFEGMTVSWRESFEDSGFSIYRKYDRFGHEM